MKRFVVALGLALGLAAAAHAVGPTASVVTDVCAALDSDSWLYALLGCGKDAAGGGSGGAG